MDGGTFDFCDVDMWFEGCLSFPLPFSLDYYCISDSEFVLFGSVLLVVVVLHLLLVEFISGADFIVF